MVRQGLVQHHAQNAQDILLQLRATDDFAGRDPILTWQRNKAARKDMQDDGFGKRSAMIHRNHLPLPIADGQGKVQRAAMAISALYAELLGALRGVVLPRSSCLHMKHIGQRTGLMIRILFMMSWLIHSLSTMASCRMLIQLPGECLTKPARCLVHSALRPSLPLHGLHSFSACSHTSKQAWVLEVAEEATEIPTGMNHMPRLHRSHQRCPSGSQWLLLTLQL